MIRGVPKFGRNDPCWCGSGKKYKRCHVDVKTEWRLSDARANASNAAFAVSLTPCVTTVVPVTRNGAPWK